MTSGDGEWLFGIQELYRPAKEPDVDIVAVHGLTGDAIRTWTFEPGNICWLSHPNFLPNYIKNARVLSWGYNANISTFGGKKTSSNRILGHAQTLVSQLQAERELEDANNRPIIFLCHSLGGIIVKQALIYAASRNAPKLSHLHTIYTCTYSIMFFGTPHNGTGKAHLLSTLQKLASLTFPKGIIQFERGLVKALGKNSETLQSILDQFAPLMHNFRIFFFWEQEKTDLKYGREYIVNETSAAPILDNTERSAIAADHRGMCRFRSNTSPGFRTTMAALQRYCKEAPQLVKARRAMATARLNENRLFHAMETMNDIETIAGKPEMWKSANMNQSRNIQATEAMKAIDTIARNPQSWRAARLNQNRQYQEAIEGDIVTSKTVRPNRNPQLRETISRDPETWKAQEVNLNRKLQPMEPINAFRRFTGNPDRLFEPMALSETRKLQTPEVTNNLPLPQVKELGYFPKHEAEDAGLGFLNACSSAWRPPQPLWTGRRIILSFLVAMVAGGMGYLLMESLQHARSSGHVGLDGVERLRYMYGESEMIHWTPREQDHV